MSEVRDSDITRRAALQGFPRADIDIPKIRADRHRLAGGPFLVPQSH